HGGHHGGGKQHDGAQHDRRCPFAGHATPATPGEPDLALAPPVAAYAALPAPPIADLVRAEWRTILLSALLPLASYALFHMVTVFPISYAVLFTEQPVSQILVLQMVGGTLAICAVILSGVLADRMSKRAVLLLSALLIVVVCFTIVTLNTAPSVYILLGFVALGLSYGQSSSIVPNRFRPEFRYSGSAMATNLSWILGAAFAPLLGLLLASTFGLWAAALYLLSGVVMTVLALSLLQRGMTRKG
ncbi:MAG: hypothetical protein CMH12_10910, partial [Maritimibacter sp.]|nr:hypothetical protein [Maritimibacter sp.]